MFQQYLLKKLVQSQLGKLPQEARDMIMGIIDKNPDLLMRMAQDVQKEKAAGKSDQDAFQAIAEKYKDDIAELRK